MSTERYDELGPIDYVIVEWQGERPNGEVIVPLLLDLVNRGIIRILDVAFLAKDADGTVSAVELSDFDDDKGGFGDFEGASSGMLDDDDLREAATALEPDTSAIVLLWENRWAAPLAVAMRRSGGQLVASGRLPVQAILARLDAAEAIH